MRALLSALEHPEQAFASVLVAGTKGKGSTVAMISACLQSAGVPAGRYTSPHLVNWRERVTVDGEPIEPEQVVALAEVIQAAVDGLDVGLGPPTTFEVGTTFAFAYFARRMVDVAVVEVGTGGRFDATNVLEPRVSVITPISYDHTATLGNALTQIAWHKAGILRRGRPAVSAPQVDEARLVIESEAHRVGAPLETVGREWRWIESGTGIRVESVAADFQALEADIGLIGDHQRDNATAAIAALHALGRTDARFDIPRAALRAGLAQVEWPGRLQVLSSEPLVVLDGAHNAASARVLRAALEQHFEFARMHLVVGLSEGKDARGVLDALAPRAHVVYLTRSRHERSAPPAELAPLVASTTHVQIERASEALEAALASAGPEDLILVTGSLFLVGEALEWWRRSRR